MNGPMRRNDDGTWSPAQPLTPQGGIDFEVTGKGPWTWVAYHWGTKRLMSGRARTRLGLTWALVTFKLIRGVIPEKRLTFGRLTIYVEPKHVWVGVDVAETAVYVCPLPLVVFKWQRATREPDRWGSADWCDNCRLPDPWNGRGDGIGSCDCPRCPDCRNPPGLCDCHWNDPDQFDLDDDDWDGAEVSR